MNLDDLRQGQVLEGRYELIDFIGEGGFARVWKAKDRQLGREVAIKLLNLGSMMLESASVRTVLQRFEREARLAASIHHPNVVQIHDIGHLQGHTERPFIVMELLTGEDLKARIDREGPCDPATFIPQFINCLDGLARAHEVGIVHKDLKPSNLFCSDPGRRTETLKLVDFGIAHINQPSAEDAAARLTSTGQLLGTPQYLPPEYIHSQRVSPAMDVYQMSLVLIEALTAEYVLGGESSLQCLIIHGDGRLELPRYLMESPLGSVIRKGLSRDPDARYEDAGALADALGELPLDRIPTRPETHGTPLERVRLDGSKLTSRVANVELAPSLLMEDTGLVPGQVPGSVPGRQHTPEAFMHTVDSIPTAPRPAPVPQRAAHPSTPSLHPPQQPLHHGPQTPMFSQAAGPQPPHQGARAPTRSKKAFNALLFFGLVFGMMLAGCMCCIAFGEEEPSDQDVEYGDVEVSVGYDGEEDPVPELFEEVDTLSAEPAAPVLGDGGERAIEDAAIALEVEEAEQILERGQKEEAIALCDRLIREVAGESNAVTGCYNVILRASWNPVTPFDEPDKKACKLLKEYLDAYPDHSIGIGVQRDIMECVAHDL